MMEVGEADSAGSIGPKPGSGLHVSSVVYTNRRSFIAIVLLYRYRQRKSIHIRLSEAQSDVIIPRTISSFVFYSQER